MGKNSKQTQETKFPPWVEQRYRQNLDEADFLTKNVMNRYGSANQTDGSNNVNVMGENVTIPGMPGQDIAPSTGGNMSGGFMGGSFTNGPPSSYISDFSQDTENYFDAARGFTGSGDALRDIAGRGPYQLDNANTYKAGTYNAGQASDFGDVANINPADKIDARRGSEFMSDYMNPYMRDVVDTTLADYDVGTDRTMAGRSAARDASGAFGNRSAIADAIFQADSNRGRAGTAANLRAAGFNTALGAGQADANRFLSADTSNADNYLRYAIANQANQTGNLDRRSMTNRFNVGETNAALSANTLAGNRANEFNSNALNAFNIANLEAKYRGDENAINALGRADAADLTRIGLMGDVGSQLDQLNQARLREPLDMLAWKQGIASGVPVQAAGTQTGTQRKSFWDYLTNAAGAAATGYAAGK